MKPSKERGRDNPGIWSDQTTPYEDLRQILTRHRETPFQKPSAEHTLQAFERAEALARDQKKPLILDSGCGVGESTVHLAQKFPDHFVLGIDKSRHRLAKTRAYFDESLRNLAFVRADLIDFWRLAARHEWKVARHYLLYPNPWPKKRDFKKRYHGHPVFFDLIQLGTYLELRSNWRLYLQEFAEAYLLVAGRQFRVESFAPNQPITPFERKYRNSGQELFRLIIRNDGRVSGKLRRGPSRRRDGPIEA